MEYGYRYSEKEWQTCFLPGIYTNHTGRLTSERHDDTKLNAYKLIFKLQ